MHHHHPSHQRVLAETPGCRVEACGCGVVHVTLGAVTIRMNPEMFDVAAQAMADASNRLALAKVSDAALPWLPKAATS